MSARAQQRAAEIEQLRAQITSHLQEINKLVTETPERLDLGSWKAMRNAVSRAVVDVRDVRRRALVRLEAKENR